MASWKNYLMDRQYVKICTYVALTSITVYVMYLLISNFFTILETISKALGSLSAAFAPALIGLILAYLLSPVVRLVDERLMTRILPQRSGTTEKVIKRNSLRRTLSILLTYLVIVSVLLLILYAFGALIGGELMFDSLMGLIDQITSYFKQYEDRLTTIGYQINGIYLQDQLRDVITSIVTWISDHFSTAAIVSFVTGLGGGVLNMVLGMVVSIYLLKDRDFFLALWRKLVHTALSKESSIKLHSVLTDIDQVISRFLRGQMLDGLIVAVIASLSLSLIGLDFAVVVGLFAGVSNIIPYFGPILGMIPAAIIGLLTGGVTQALYAVLVLFLIQQVDSAVISPRVVGKSTGLHPVMVLIAVTVGGYYWGIIGMLLAVPSAGILRILVMRRIESIKEEIS